MQTFTVITIEDYRHGACFAPYGQRTITAIANCLKPISKTGVWAFIIFGPPYYDLYLKYSQIAWEIYGELEPFGLDECLLDVTSNKYLFGDGKAIEDKPRERIKFDFGVLV